MIVRLALLIFSFCTTLVASAQDTTRTMVQFPPNLELIYQISAKQSGIPISGKATIKFLRDEEGRYSIVSETRAAIFGKILETTSQGKTNSMGFVPDLYTEKRLGSDMTKTFFEREKNPNIHFSNSALNYPISGGEQDRTSATWQVVALIRAAASKRAAGTEIKMFVAGKRDAEPWTFKVQGEVKIETPMGELACLHILKLPPPDAKGQQLELWLAAEKDWLPIRIKFSDSDGNRVDQLLEKLTPLP